MTIKAASPTSPWGAHGPEVEFDESVEAVAHDPIVELLSGWDASAFGCGPIRLACLPGGANNRNYRLEGPDVKLALRIASPQSERLAVDRASAIQAQQDAAAAGVGPEVLAFQLPEGHTLSRFLEGTVLPWESLTDRHAVREVGLALRRLHGTPSSCRIFCPFEEIRHWFALAREDGTAFANDIDELIGLVERVEEVILAAELFRVFCHNDTVPQNFIRCVDAMRLVDWDYAGRGWAAFELAAFCNTSDLDTELSEVLLEVYSGGASDAQRATIRLLSFVAAMREVAWAYMAKPMLEGATTLLEGWSYDGFLASNLERARRVRRSGGFDDLFERAAAQRNRQW